MFPMFLKCSSTCSQSSQSVLQHVPKVPKVFFNTFPKIIIRNKIGIVSQQWPVKVFESFPEQSFLLNHRPSRMPLRAGQLTWCLQAVIASSRDLDEWEYSQQIVATLVIKSSWDFNLTLLRAKVDSLEKWRLLKGDDGCREIPC
jgi:hypothetical protein